MYNDDSLGTVHSLRTGTPSDAELNLGLETTPESPLHEFPGQGRGSWSRTVNPRYCCLQCGRCDMLANARSDLIKLLSRVEWESLRLSTTPRESIARKSWDITMLWCDP